MAHNQHKQTTEKVLRLFVPRYAAPVVGVMRLVTLDKAFAAGFGIRPNATRRITIARGEHNRVAFFQNGD